MQCSSTNKVTGRGQARKLTNQGALELLVSELDARCRSSTYQDRLSILHTSDSQAPGRTSHVNCDSAEKLWMGKAALDTIAIAYGSLQTLQLITR